MLVFSGRHYGLTSQHQKDINYKEAMSKFNKATALCQPDVHVIPRNTIKAHKLMEKQRSVNKDHKKLVENISPVLQIVQALTEKKLVNKELKNKL